MKKTMKRTLAGAFLMLLVTLSGIGTIILFPQPLFANSMTYHKFRVYSNDEIDNNIKVVLDNAFKLVQKSELHDPNYGYDVFVSYNSTYNEIDDRILGHGPSARATDNNVVIKVRIDATKNLFFPTFYQKCEGDLTYLIAHEMIHCLQSHKYGKLKFNPFRHPEMWKLEGYPEYISRQNQLRDENYSLSKEIERYVELEGELTDIWISITADACKAPKYYYKSRLMTEYLIDVKKYSYDRILNDTLSEEKIFSQMLEWKEADKRRNYTGLVNPNLDYGIQR
jgi:hypothetical protein